MEDGRGHADARVFAGTYEQDIARAASLISSAKHAIALTGAGVSVESGIPTFRGRDGLWNKYNPIELATPEAFARNPVLVWKWYAWRIGLVMSAVPSAAHSALYDMEKMGVIKWVITQNVDDLHERAGSRNVVHLHGIILRARCTKCDYSIWWNDVPKIPPIPKCESCGEPLRPDVIWFGEPLNEEALSKAWGIAQSSDLILVIGTSAVVYPAAAIPLVVKENGGKIVEINPDVTPLTPYADVYIKEGASYALRKILEALKK
ncbi:MAG: NAD-dependent protein deacylase [Thermoplasmata archaeon]|nr:MAG: NAD-dependent protein deacylase [Thermoplasmata archaeon]